MKCGVMLGARAAQRVLCPSCVICRSTYTSFQRTLFSRSLLNFRKSETMQNDKASEKRYTNFKAAPQSQAPSLLAQKMARQKGDQRTLPPTERSSTDGLKSRLENLLIEWDDNKSLSLASSEDDEMLKFSNDETGEAAVETILFPSDFERNEKVSPILGTEDRDIPPSTIPCCGCGAPLQCQHNTFPGFMPSEYFKSLSENELKTSICQRCYYIRHCEAFKEVSTDQKQYISMISKIRPTQSVVVLVVDVMDMGGSIVPNLMDYIGDKHPLVVVGNKADLLSPDRPKYLSHVREILKSTCHSSGLTNIHKVTLVSAKTGFGIERLISMLFAFYKRRVDLYIVGTANAGKSSLFNALLASDYCKSSARDLIERATVSVWPGTTLNLLKFPIMRPGHRVHALRQRRLKQEQAQKKMERQLEKTRKKEKADTTWELKGDVHVTDTRSDSSKEYDDKGEAWGQKIAGFCGRDDGSLEYEILEPAKETYDAHQYDQSYWTFDTPGVINPEQVLHSLTPKEMMLLTPTSMITPRCLILKPQETLFVSGLCRIDLQKSDTNLFLAVHSGPNIPIHTIPTREADDFYAAHLGTETLGIPIGDRERLSKLPSLVAQTVEVVGEGEEAAMADIQLSSIGWMSIALKRDLGATLQVFTPGRKGIYLRRPALMPHYSQFKGKRIRGSSFYRTKPPGWVMSRAK